MTSQADPQQAPQTARARAKAERRHEILAAAARLMAEHGFHGVRLDDIGTEVGISGPAVYRYFSSKDEALAEMLLDISARLRDGGQAVVDAGGEPRDVLAALIAGHVAFVVAEPDLISVQFRDLGLLAAGPRRRVQALQRQYVEAWVQTLRAERPELEETAARAQVHAVFGLLNSSPRLPRLPTDQVCALLSRMARAALSA